MSKKKTKFKFKCPLFRVEVFLVLGDRKQVGSMVGEGGEKYHDAECCTLYDEDDIVKGFLVWILTHDDYHAMVHETMHLTKRIFEVIGIPFNLENDEIMAYYQNYWVRKFWDKMSKFIKT